MSEPIWRFRGADEVAPEGSMLTNMGWLVPVERCEHGNIDRHPYSYVAFIARDLDDDEWCPGAGIGDTNE